MAKKIAIIIGISDYKNLTSLKGCKVDADSIRMLLNTIGKYDDILQLDGKVDAAEIDQKLPEFIKKYKSESVNEVFFYYSGHGGLINDIFTYAASDFDNNRPNYTSISNDTVDSLLKSLNANLVVKIIDACQSGIQYLKDTDVIIKYMNHRKDEFTNCYFMFSSRNDQPSMATTSLSVFTRSFIQAVKSCPIGSVKYENIAKCIADDFINNLRQTPQFVTQAELTEVFCDKDSKLEDVIDKILNGGTINSNSKPVDAESPLLRAIKLDSLSYKSEDQIVEMLEKAKGKLDSITHKKDIPELFDFSISLSQDLSGFTKKNEIGEWLSKRKHNYFAKPEYSSYNSIQSFLPSQTSISKEIKDYSKPENLMDYLLNTYVSGFKPLIDFPFVQVVCLYTPRLENLSAFKIRLTFVCSKTELVLFSYVQEIQNVKDMASSQEVSPLSISIKKIVDCEVSDEFINQILFGEDAIIATLKNQFLNVPDFSIG